MIRRSFHLMTLALWLAVSVLLLSCGGTSGSSQASESVDTQGQSQSAALTLQLNTAIIPRALFQTVGTPDSIVIEVLHPQTRQAVHTRSQFTFSRTQSVQTFTVSNVVPGTHVVKVQIFGTTGASFFAGERTAQLNPGQSTSVSFTFGGGTGTTPSPTFRCVENADDEQGQPDVDMADDGYFFVVGKVTDSSDNGGDFDGEGFIHAERFQATFDGMVPVSIDATNGNNGDFDVSQFSTLEAKDGTNLLFDQGAVFPRISMNASKAAVITWLDGRPSPSAGGVPGANAARTPVIRSVILGPTSNTTPNTDGHVEPEYTNPGNAEPNIAGPNAALQRPSVSFTNDSAGNAIIDYAFFNGATPQSPRFRDGGASQGGVPANGAPPLPQANNNITAVFNPAVNLVVANRKTVTNSVVIVGQDMTLGNRVAAEITIPPAPAPGFTIINAGQPSEADVNDRVRELEVDWFESGTIVVVYSILDVSVGGTGLYARCFDAGLNTAVGPEIEIAAAANGVHNRYPDVAAVNSDGTFLATWTREAAGGAEVQLQRFNCASGARTPAAPIAFSVGQGGLVTTNQNRFSRVACTTNGDAVVVWQSGVPTLTTFAVKLFGRVFPNASTNQ